MKRKYGIIVLILFVIIRPLHATVFSHGAYSSHTSFHLVTDDSTTNKEQPPSKNNQDEHPQDDSSNDDSMDHNDSESDEDLEDIPDDFYDYQEENF
ncbi:MAG TPA: hypothetical protein PLV81_08155 [Spirochaetota bacterium]|mgnify:FL=1|nr:hypothetical protein [Spirochaetota bacterium]